MKCLLLLTLSFGLMSIAQAQRLPVPGARNPDWRLLQAKPPLVPTSGTDRMPSPKGLSSIGNHYFYWDSERQLRYEWDSRPNSPAPAALVTVHEDATGTVYTYRRQLAAPAPSRQWRRLTPNK